jgi:hypothetical protein
MTYTKQSVLWQTHNKLIKWYSVYKNTKRKCVKRKKLEGK